MTKNTNDHHYVPCIGHIFKAVFLMALIVIVLNCTHIVVAVKHHDYIHIPAPAVSVFCYICLIIALGTWVHYFFYPEFYLNSLALPIKVILSVYLLFNSIDLLETNMDELGSSTDVGKDVFHTIRAIFILVGVVFELYVFRLCQKAHHLMKAMNREEGRNHFHLKDFLTAKEVLKNHQAHHSTQPNEIKETSKGEETKKANNSDLCV